MHRKTSLCVGAGAAVAACVASTAALAQNTPWNPAGFYIGAGVGESDIRNNGNYGDSFGYPGYFDQHHATWKAIAGLRPISPLGVELEYIDFGNPDNGNNYFNATHYGAGNHPTAGAAFAVGYLPIPLPFLDIYGKAGVARLDQRITSDIYTNCVGTVCASPPTAFRVNQWNTDFAYGAGVQGKFGNFAVRGEYERISQTGGDPDAYTVGFTWTF
jgi:opacity protein-like surface antigen